MERIRIALDGYHAADEVARHVAARLRHGVILLKNVLPEIVLLVGSPSVVALVQRYPKLAVLGHQPPERSLLSAHVQNIRP